MRLFTPTSVVRSLREMLSPLVADFKNEKRGIVWGLLFMAVLFLCYVYFGKYAFLKHSGYGLLPRSGQGAHYFKYAGWFLSSFFFLFVVPVLFIALHPRLKISEYGLGLGDVRYGAKLFALLSGIMVAIVVLLVIFKAKGFMRYYPMYAKHVAQSQAKDFLLWFVFLEFCYLLYFIGWEFFFRGLLVFSLEKRFGTLSALFGVLPFAIMHLGKPPVEAFGSIAAAYFLAMLALRCRSFWVCAVIHFFVAFSMDLSAAIARGMLG